MFSTSTRRTIKEFLVNTFSVEQILYISKELESHFDPHRIMHFSKKLSIQRSELANAVVEYFHEKNVIDQFISIMLNTDEYRGKIIKHNHVSSLSRSLAHEGLMYNFEKHRIEKLDKSGVDFGILFNDKSYYLSFISIDIVGSSKFVSSYPSDQVLEAFNGFRNFVKEKVDKYNGRIWEWEGDGGIIAFHENMAKGALCGIEILLHIVLFNNTINCLDENINIRIANHAGWILYKDNYQNMALGIKDKAEDFQKHAAQVNGYVVTEEVYKHLDSKLRYYFESFNTMGVTLYQFNKDNLTFSKRLENV